MKVKEDARDSDLVLEDHLADSQYMRRQKRASEAHPLKSTNGSAVLHQVDTQMARATNEGEEVCQTNTMISGMIGLMRMTDDTSRVHVAMTTVIMEGDEMIMGEKMIDIGLQEIAIHMATTTVVLEGTAMMIMTRLSSSKGEES